LSRCDRPHDPHAARPDGAVDAAVKSGPKRRASKTKSDVRIVE
jgi:hypothetical protein